LQTKLKDSLQPEAVAEATTWLARPDVRLITPVNSGETGGYELSHERLIPALTRLAGKELSEADRVNQLLDRRVNEWLGNQRSRRYLFNWRELRLIQRHKPFLIWGGKRRQKERLIAQSQRSVYGKLTAVLAILLSILLGWLWLSSPTGIIWQTRRELVQLSGKVPDSTAAEAAKALAVDGQFDKALKICERDIQSSYFKASMLSTIAEAYIQLEDKTEAAKLLSQAMAIVEKIDN
jgi:tetratricopeptide (TPR) repeat protein